MIPRVIITLILITGIGLFLYSVRLPYYKNEKAANELISKAYDIDKTQYYKQDSELRTNKLPFEDLGSGLTIFSAIILVFMIVFKIRTFNDFKNVKSLNKTWIYIASNVIWLILIPSTFWYYTYRGGRGDYPPFADSIGIPIFTSIPIYLTMLIPLNLFIFLTSIKSVLPALIFTKANNYSKTAILWEIFWVFWLLINILCMIGFVSDGDHLAIPVNLFFTFVLLTLRAGKISRLNEI